MRVFSFNIRNGNANDGDHSWPNRRHVTAQTIRDASPDLIGLQEVFDFQLDYLLEQLPDYAAYSAGRDYGERGGEACSILWRKGRFAPLDKGTFWLSDTPDVPGSMSWGNEMPRICSWVDFGSFTLFNTHWDHQSVPARLKSSELIHRNTPLTPWILCGDFNAEPDSAEVLALPGILHTPDTCGTFHGFTGGDGGDRIDHILSSSDLRVAHLEVMRTQIDGLYPSDHYPVIADVLLS